MSILEGLVKAESTINPDTDINTNIDMSSNPNITYNIEKIENHHHHYCPQIVLPPMDEATLVRVLKELSHAVPAIPYNGNAPTITQT